MSFRSDKLTVGILAHVDAGKTTLAESIMYLTGGIRKPGRVDHGNAFLDTHELERARGITIFSKQAEVTIHGEERDLSITLLDTPGHVDFSAEAERTLQVLDAAILVISGSDGVLGHVQTLWKLLKRYEVPVFLFINKMDQPGTDVQSLMEELKKRLDENCVNFTYVNPRMEKESGLKQRSTEQEEFLDELSMCSEELMEAYLEKGALEEDEIGQGIFSRKVFPCYFGSALKIWGVEALLMGLAKYGVLPEYPEQFGARVYKISRDGNGNRLTHMKIIGGSLKVKSMLGQEKADQIRIYSGNQFKLTEEAKAGHICAVTGLNETRCGQGVGCAGEGNLPMLVPVLNYQICLPENCDVHKMLKNLYQLEEEIPELHIVWQEQKGEIHAQVMGEVQVEILRSLIYGRFGVEVTFGEGSIVYKETIVDTVEGIGHYEPLRHYAEVHLKLEPLETGSGLVFEMDCSEDELDRNWQRLIMTHLEEKQHVGVLIGAPITDMKITLLAGRAHLKHTEGGDFRQATYRAVRHGLMCAQSRLLEPCYEYRLEIPGDCVGRAMTDIQRMSGTFTDPMPEGEMMVLTGTCPVVTMNGYQSEVNTYSRGNGRLTCRFQGYAVCHNEEEIIEACGYDPERDLDHPAGSVFCAHGAGFVVPWNQVAEYAHVEVDPGRIMGEKSGRMQADDWENGPYASPGSAGRTNYPTSSSAADRFISQEEIEDIFERTYGTRAKDKNPWNRPEPRRVSVPEREVEYRPAKKEKLPEYLLVDGYNIIFAWEDLRELSQINVEAARTKLMDMLCNYQGYLKNTLIVVFDAYKVKGNPGTVSKYHNIHVVYTKEAETADQYIEKTVHQIGKKYKVTVATSDALEQMIIWGEGAVRMSAQGLRREMEEVDRIRQAEWNEQNPGEKYFPFRNLL